MVYQATIIPIMIASPGDVTKEREIIREVIHDWNDVNASDTKVLLVAVGWETHSSPELGSRPQELINTRILKDCDLLVGVFWTRLGTPTDKFPSGTVEEIEKHVASGKPAMIYFSSSPVAPESIDTDQYYQVKDTREKWKKQGLIEVYENIAEFRKKFSKQLQLCLIKNEYIQQTISSKTDNNVPGDHSIVSSENDKELSDEAKVLLKSAAMRDDGTIVKTTSFNGLTIQAGSKSFGCDSAREAAKWEDALNELETANLVIARGYKGEIYELTHKGWIVADSL